MKWYYAIFKSTSEAIEVNFPDLEGCATFGDNQDEAYDRAIDVLTAWLANADIKFIKEPSSYEDIKHLEKGKSKLIPVPVDEDLYLYMTYSIIGERK